MTEVWKDIPGYEFFYQASSLGRIRSLDRIVPHKHGSRFQKGKIRKAGISRKTGYLSLPLNRKGEEKTYPVHVLVALVFIGPRPSDGHDIDHIDGNRLNNRADNLRYRRRGEHAREAGGKTKKVKQFEPEVPELEGLPLFNKIQGGT